MKRREFLISAATFAALSACTKPEYTRATQSEVRAAYYHSDAPPSISLLNMVNENTDSSEHAGLLINGSQRVLYDPAGDYWVKGRPRKDDIHYGMTDQWVRQYESFHARLGYYVLKQTIYVDQAVADLAIRKAQEKGETYHTQCASSITWVLRQLPGFSSIPQTMFPDHLRNSFARLPNLKVEYFYEDDVGQNYKQAPVEGFDPQDTAPPAKPRHGRGEREFVNDRAS